MSQTYALSIGAKTTTLDDLKRPIRTHYYMAMRSRSSAFQYPKMHELE